MLLPLAFALDLLDVSSVFVSFVDLLLFTDVDTTDDAEDEEDDDDDDDDEIGGCDGNGY